MCVTAAVIGSIDHWLKVHRSQSKNTETGLGIVLAAFKRFGGGIKRMGKGGGGGGGLISIIMEVGWFLAEIESPCIFQNALYPSYILSVLDQIKL